MNSQCPVCLGRIAPHLFNGHMSNHSKEEIVAALLRQTTPASVPQVPISIPETTAPSSSTSNSQNNVPNNNGLPPQPYPGFHFMATPGDLSSSPFIGTYIFWLSYYYIPTRCRKSRVDLHNLYGFFSSSTHDGYEHGNESYTGSSTKWSPYDYQRAQLRLSTKYAKLSMLIDFQYDPISNILAKCSVRRSVKFVECESIGRGCQCSTTTATVQTSSSSCSGNNSKLSTFYY